MKKGEEREKKRKNERNWRIGKMKRKLRFFAQLKINEIHSNVCIFIREKEERKREEKENNKIKILISIQIYIYIKDNTVIIILLFILIR